MALESLFLKEMSDQDSSTTKLPHDPVEWDEVLITKLMEKIPSIQGMLIKPKMTHISEETGTAVGAITVMEQKTQQAVFIPVIVKGFQLLPMDVMLVPDAEQNYNASPLTAELLNECLMNAQPFNYLEKPIDRIQELYFNPQNTHVFPPYLRNVHASSGVLDYIAHTITPAQKGEFMAHLKANPTVLVGYEKRANLHLLEKISQTEYEPWEEQDHNNPNIIHMKALTNGKIAVTSTNSDLFNPVICVGKVHGEFDQRYPKDTLNEVLTNGEKVIATDYDPMTSTHIFHGREMLGPHESPGAYTVTGNAVVEANLFGKYRIQGLDGIQYTGVLFPEVIDFSGKTTGLKIFYNENCHSLQTSFAGVYVDSSTERDFQCVTPTYGMTGFLMCLHGTKAIALSPMTIKGTAESDDGSQYYKAMDFLGNVVRFSMGYGGRKVVAIDGVYQIPESYYFLSLKNFKPMSETVESSVQKTASKIMDANPVRVIHTGSNQFALKGSGIAKMAGKCNWDPSNLDCGQAAFLLASKKCPMNKIAAAMKAASFYPDGVTLHGLPEVQYSQARPAPFVLKPVNLIKEASYIDDSQVVDTLLGLNFINPENIQKFYSMTPVLKSAAGQLAQLLLASRLGMNEIPASACSTAMYKLVDVIKGLERLKMHIEENKAGA